MEQSGTDSYLQHEVFTPEQLIRRYCDALVRFAYGFVRDSAAAEDAAADAIATLVFHKKRFADESRLRAYLYKVTRNRCIDYLRRHSRSTDPEDLESVLISEDIADLAQRKMRNASVYVCMQQLPDPYREVLQLQYFDGFGTEQTARIMGKTTKQVYNLHARAKVALRNLLEKEGITHEDL